MKKMNWKTDKHLKGLLLIMNNMIKKDLDNDREVHYIVKSLNEKEPGKEYLVKQIQKGSHEIFTCDCANNITAKEKDKLKEWPLCYHKIGVILFIQKNEVFK